MYLLKLLVKNAFRHRLRTLLTIVGITIAILAFGLLRTVVSAWYAGVEASSASRLVTRNAISLIFSLPISYREKLIRMPGVRQVTYANWFGGVYVTEKNFFPNFAIEPKSYLELYPEFVLDPAEKEAFLHDRKGAVAGRKLAQRFGWKVGDSIPLRGTIFPGSWQFVLRGIYKGVDKSTDENQFFFQWEYLNESMLKTAPHRANMVGIYLLGLTNPNLAAEVSRNVDATFKNSLAETLSETEKAFQLSFIAMTEAIVIAIQIVSFVVIVIILAVVANTMAMTARERIGEYAVYKTLGFSWWHIAGMIFGESFFITFTGCALGMALTFPVAKSFGEQLGNFVPVFQVARETLYLDIAAALVIGLIAGIFPTWRAVTIRIADGLRRIG